MTVPQHLSQEQDGRWSLWDEPRPDSHPVFLQRTADGRVGLVPEGFVMVPREADQDMCDAAKEVLIDDGRGRHTALNWTEAGDVYRAMLAASQVSSDPAPAIPAGMKPWTGGDAAPEDWDGGPVLWKNGVTVQPSCERSFRSAVNGGVMTIIAATPSPQPEGAAEVGEAVPAKLRDADTENVRSQRHSGWTERGHAWLDAGAPFAVPEGAETSAIPDGMMPWHGADTAPEDWDGGPVLLRSGDIRRYPDEWQHGNTIQGRHWDIIAYTPRPQPEGAPDALVERKRIISEARRNLRLVQGCLDCNADDERRWSETIAWLEGLA